MLPSPPSLTILSSTCRRTALSALRPPTLTCARGASATDVDVAGQGVTWAKDNKITYTYTTADGKVAIAAETN